MKPEIKKRLIRTAVLSVVALVIGAGVAMFQISMNNARVMKPGEQNTTTAMPIAGLEIGGPFTLTNQDGEKVTEATYDGQYKFIYFGFTYCPAICPTELQKMSRVMSALEKNHKDAADTIQPIFITVDPERDTVDVMRQYVNLFHPRMIGLTGTQPQIDFVKKGYRIFATKVQDDTMNDYTVDHSSYLYLMGPDNALVSIYRMDDKADEIYKDIETRLNLSAS